MRQLKRGSIILEKDDAGKCTYVQVSQVYTSTRVMRLTHVTALEELLANVPDVCPLLQQPIDWSREDRDFESFSPNSPSIDRIDNTKGMCVVFSHFKQYSLTLFFVFQDTSVETFGSFPGVPTPLKATPHAPSLS